MAWLPEKPLCLAHPNCTNAQWLFEGIQGLGWLPLLRVNAGEKITY